MMLALIPLLLITAVPAHGSSLLKLSAQQETTARKQLEQLTLEQKIGQLFVVAAVSNEQENADFITSQPYTMHKEYIEQLITDYHIGGIIWLGSGTAEQQYQRTQQYQALSRVPLLIAQDCEWGLSQRLRNAVRFPLAMTLGALRDEQAIYTMGHEIGRHARALGIHMVLAPVADVNNNPENPIIHDRSFGDNAQDVARKATLFARGLCDAGVIPCAKHFPGHGDTATDSHHDVPYITYTRDRLEQVELVPFKALIAAGIPAVMTAHLALPALDATNTSASISPAITTTLLRSELGFTGLVVTDGLGMKAVTTHRAAGGPELEAFMAGNDILLCPVAVTQAIAQIQQAIAQGRVSIETLNATVLRILRAKQWAHADRKPEDYAIVATTINAPHAHTLKQQLFSQAITIARDRCNLLANTANRGSTAYLHIAPSQQQTAVEQAGSSTHYYLTGNESTEQFDLVQQELAQYATVIITVAGMCKHQYMKEQGLIKQYGISTATQDCITTLCSSGNQIILVLFGTPYSIKLFRACDTIIVAYEDDPITQEAVQKILDGRCEATGKLPVQIT